MRLLKGLVIVAGLGASVITPVRYVAAVGGPPMVGEAIGTHVPTDEEFNLSAPHISADLRNQVLNSLGGHDGDYHDKGVLQVTMTTDAIRVVVSDDAARGRVLDKVKGFSATRRDVVTAAEDAAAAGVRGMDPKRGFGSPKTAGDMHYVNGNAWPSGDKITGLSGATRCSEGIPMYDIGTGSVRFWVTTAGHCRFNPDGSLTDAGQGFTDESDGWVSGDTTYAWNPYVYGWSKDASLYLAKSGDWTPPQAVKNRSMWDWCPSASGNDCPNRVVGSIAGRWQQFRGRGQEEGWIAKTRQPNAGELICKTGATTGTSCGVYGGIDVDGQGHMNWLDGCGADGGDSGGAVYLPTPAGNMPLGWTSRINSDQIPSPPECDGQTVFNHVSSYGTVYYTTVESVQGFGGQIPYTW